MPRSSYPGPIHGASTSPWSAPCCPQRSTEERKFCGTAATALRRDGGPSAVTGGFKSPSDLARNPLRRWRNERSQRNQRRCAGSVSGVGPRYDTSNQKHYAPTLRTTPPGGATARTAHVALALLLPLMLLISTAFGMDPSCVARYSLLVISVSSTFPKPQLYSLEFNECSWTIATLSVFVEGQICVGRCFL